MEPLVAKIIYMIGYWAANFVIRAPYIKAHQRLAIRANRKTRADTGFFLAVGVGGFFLPLVYVFTPVLAFANYSSPLWVGLGGVVVLLLGNWVFWKSHKDLGTNWSPTLEIREKHTLVTHGIYRRIRHPMYLSIWLLVIAQAMILPNYVAGFSGVVPFALLYFLRVPNEERMMREEFGESYDAYLLGTGRILPRLQSGRSQKADKFNA
jgi:protein-S-isoprenylcysteine O-methyltransferase Ste14